MVFDLPLFLRVELVSAVRFSLSEENDAAGEGDNEAIFNTCPWLRRVCSSSGYPFSSSSFSSAGVDMRARRAITNREGLGDALGEALLFV